MYDFLELIRSRRSIRRYQPRPVPAQLINLMLQAAIRAPSAHNRQPWRFVVIEGDEMKRQLAAAMGERLRSDLAADGLASEQIERDAARSYARISGAPLLILICMTLSDMDNYPDEQRASHEATMAIQSVAMAGQNMMLAAHALGLGSCWMCGPLFCPATVRRTLDLPDDWQPQGLIVAGFPAEEKEKTRYPLDTRVLFR